MGAAVLRGLAGIVLLLGACGSVNAPGMASAEPWSRGSTSRPSGPGILARAEAVLLATANNPARTQPLSRPRLPVAVRPVAVIDGEIRGGEVALARLVDSDADYPVIMLDVAAAYRERAFVRWIEGDGDAAVHDDRAALELLQELTTADRFGGFRRLDEALFMLAEIHAEQGMLGEMTEAHVRLAFEFSGQYLPGVFLAAADRAFEGGDVAAATRLYEKVLTFEMSPLRGYALYRLAWCHKADGDVRRSRLRFEQAIRAASAGRAGTPAEGRVLAAAARTDLARLAGG